MNEQGLAVGLDGGTLHPKWREDGTRTQAKGAERQKILSISSEKMRTSFRGFVENKAQSVCKVQNVKGNENRADRNLDQQSPKEMCMRHDFRLKPSKSHAEKERGKKLMRLILMLYFI